MFSVIHPASARLSRRMVLLVGLLAGIAFAAIPVASARADLINTSACDGAPLTQPFLPWLDQEQYKLVPGGTFEGGAAGWTLAGGARVVPGSEPFAVTGSLGRSSLYLPAGATAQSPLTCVNAAYPALRLLARNGVFVGTAARLHTGKRRHHHRRRHHRHRHRHGAHTTAALRSLSTSSVVVQVVYKNPLGGLVIPVGTVSLTGSWQPSLPMTTLSAVPGALGGGTAQVAIRFTAVGGASQVDDVFVDPRMH